MYSFLTFSICNSFTSHLIQCYGVCSERDPASIVTEYMCHGTLLDFLRKGKGHHYPLSRLLHCAVQIACGMSYLEKEGYIHRDLKAARILVGSNFVCKIAGFRFARILKNDEYISETKEKMQIRWTAPEAVRYGRFSIKSDVWSYGILLTEIVSKGETPYHGMADSVVLDMTQKGYKMDYPTGCSQSLYKVMLKCWSRLPRDRPTFQYLYETIREYFATELDCNNYTDH